MILGGPRVTLSTEVSSERLLICAVGLQYLTMTVSYAYQGNPLLGGVSCGKEERSN